MMIREGLLSMCILLPLIRGIQIDDECFYKSNHEEVLYDEYTRLTAWVGKNRSLPILKMQVEFMGREFHEFDEITIMANKMKLKSVRKGEETKESEVSYTRTIEAEWLEVEFYSGNQYKLNFGMDGNYIFEEENYEVKEKLIVEGHLFTINCPNKNVIWRIEKKISVIPLMYAKLNEFTLYSKRPYMPKLIFGNQELVLGWRDNRVDDVTMYNEEYKEELPGLKQIEITVECNISCIVQLQDGEKVSKMYSSEMKIIGLEDQIFYLILRLPYNSQKAITWASQVTEPVSEPPGVLKVLTVAVIVLIIIIIILAIIIIVWIHKGKKKKHSNINVHDETEYGHHPLMEQTQADCFSNQYSIHSTVGELPSDYLYNAVMDEDIEQIKVLLKSKDDNANPIKKMPGKMTSPQQEAHIRGCTKIVNLFNKNMGLEKQFPSGDLMDTCIKVFTVREKEIFTAAKYGNYERNSGLHNLLKNYGIPGTIIDSKGWSILHHMANNSYEDGRPVWSAGDIKSFLTEHTHFINAVDFFGNTPLHIIANHKSKGDNKITWDSGEYTSDDAWVELAKLFFAFGCNPHLVNHQNKTAFEVARTETISNKKIADYLEKILDDVKPLDYDTVSMMHGELIKESEKGNIEKMLLLLKKGVPLLSVSSKHNMLNAAIRNGERDAIFLLLCAGMPLCNITTEAFTSLQVAHHTKGLPALIPILLRKVYADRIATEMLKVEGKDDIYKDLHDGMKKIKEQILSKGDKFQWEFKSQTQEDKNSEARKLLFAASELGLSLTVQLLGTENVDLRPLPGEKSSVEVVVEKGHFDTLIVLTRDLKMPPYAHPEKLDDMLNKLGCALWFCERKILRDKALDDENKYSLGLTEEKVDDFIQKLRLLKENEEDNDRCGEWDKGLLYLLAKYGLVYILHLIKRRCKDLKLSQVVQSFSKSTMLHVSVFFKQLHMTEYLLNHGADPEALSNGGFTVLHTAALSGQKENFDFISNFMKNVDKNTEYKCNLDLTAEQLMTLQLNLNKEREESLYPPLTTDDAVQVLSVSNDHEVLFNLLDKRGDMLKFKKMDYIVDKAEFMIKKNSQNKNNEIFIEETKKLFDLSKQYTAVTEYGPSFEVGDVLLENYAKLFLESKDLCAYGTNKNVKCRSYSNDNIMSKFVQLSEIEGLSNNELLTEEKHQGKDIEGPKFLKEFCFKVQSQIKESQIKHDAISLCPPYAVPYYKGIKIFWISKKGDKLKQYRIYLEPVIKSHFPSDVEKKELPQNMEKIKEKYDWVYIHLTKNLQSWTYRAVPFEKELFKSLKPNEQKVWIICKMIKLLTEKYWWTQNLYDHQYLKPWRSEPNYSKLLPESALKSLFMDEMSQVNEHNWRREDIRRRIVSIFGRPTQREDVIDINAFLPPNYFLYSDRYVVPSILKYVDSIPDSKVQFSKS